ncbi:IS66 family transposase [Bacteroides fluxus]|nr:transposase [Bacteroides fluxus]
MSLSCGYGSITIDGYNVYKLLDRHREGVVRYGCMAHVRRKFVEALHTDSHSAKVVQLISELYWVESDCRIHFLSGSERVLERKKRSIPVLHELWQLLKRIFDETKDLAATLFIKAVRYAVHEWEAVCRYVTNGQAEIDNNTAERLMKPICLGRKNYLFFGSEQAAKNTSLVYSIIESCKMNGLRPVKYIADVLRKLISGDTDYMALLLMNIENNLIINQKYNSRWAIIPLR